MSEYTVSCIELADELHKKMGNLMRIIKGKKLPYIENIGRNAKGQVVKERFISEEVANEIRNPTKRKRITWNISKIDDYITEHQLPLKRLFTEYTRVDDEDIWWQCNEDETHKWQTSWGNIYHSGSGCHYCNGQAKWSYERILETIEKDHPTKLLLTEENAFIDPHSPMLWKCLIDGYEWESSWMKINWQGTGCHMCSGNIQWDIDSIKKELLKPEFYNIDYISGIYKNNKKSLLLWKCLYEGCAHTWELPWYNINVKGTRCPICSMRGTYHPTNLEQNKEAWLKEHLIVYTLLCWDDDTNERFYKIGVTIKSGAQLRYTSHRTLPYKFKVLKEEFTNRYDGGYREIELLDNHKPYRYTPKKFFAGHTECVSDIIHFDINTIDINSLKTYSRKRNK